MNMNKNMDNIIDSLLTMETYYERTELCTIMQRYGSDKGLGHHNYTTLYTPMLKHLKKQADVNVFELGIGTNNPDLPSSMGVGGMPGASLRGWAQWLPYASVVGADIDKNILFKTDRITTYFVDQRDESTIQNLWDQEATKDVLFDLILDDGLHEYVANDTFLTHSHHKVKPGGLYIVEDIMPNDVAFFQAALSRYLQWFSYGRVVTIPNPRNHIDNRLLILKK